MPLRQLTDQMMGGRGSRDSMHLCLRLSYASSMALVVTTVLPVVALRATATGHESLWL